MLRINIWPKCLSDALVTLFLFIIIPLIFYFELFVVLPKFYELWSAWYCFHFLTGTFILWNICTNLIAIILTDTSIKGRILQAVPEKNWKFCSVCETLAPPRSWHCNTCNVCILKRDHHCMFTSCCIGYFNHRYFIVFTLYMFVATVYASYYNVYFLLKFVDFGTWSTVFKLIFPLAALFIKFTQDQIYIALVLVVLIGALFTGFLLYFHLDLILKGLVTHERKRVLGEYDLGKLKNIQHVFGTKYYLVWLSPFIKSDLIGDGIDWTTKQSLKGK